MHLYLKLSKYDPFDLREAPRLSKRIHGLCSTSPSCMRPVLPGTSQCEACTLRRKTRQASPRQSDGTEKA